MKQYREMLRLDRLGMTRVKIAANLGCGHNTVTRTLWDGPKRKESRGSSPAA